MSPPQIVWSRRAENDLQEIDDYVQRRDGPTRAAAILDQLLATIGALAATPRMGRGRPYLSDGTRAFPVAPWIVFYTSLPTADGILIIRIVDGRRDLPAVLA